MLGGAGWSEKVVKDFLGSNFYTIPCGAVPKGSDPHGRIIHDYSYAIEGGLSINSSLLENSVQYISFVNRVRALEKVKWYVSLDLKMGPDNFPFTHQTGPLKFMPYTQMNIT